MDSKKIGVALIGVGYWGSKLERYIVANEHFRLKHKCNSESDLNIVWNDAEVTAIVNATPNKFHYLITRQALFHNKHVLTEKPLALTTHQCLELRKLAQQRNLKLQTEYTFTFSKALQQAKQWIAQNKIGQLLAFTACVKHLGRFGGGSVYWLLGSHILAVLNSFIPLNALSFSRKDLIHYNGNVETGIIQFHGLIQGQIFVSLNHPHKETKITFYGEHGTITYNPLFEVAPLKLTTYKRLSWVIGQKLPKHNYSYCSDESNNLRRAIQNFHLVLTNKSESNLNMSVEVTRVLESIQK